MITYGQIALKDDKIFLGVARKVLRAEFDLVVDDARQAMQKAYSEESCNLKRINSARRAANLVILAALGEYGITNWRELGDKQPVKRTVKPVTDSGVTVKASKYTGKSILEMADERSNKKSM